MESAAVRNNCNDCPVSHGRTARSYTFAQVREDIKGCACIKQRMYVQAVLELIQKGIAHCG